MQYIEKGLDCLAFEHRRREDERRASGKVVRDFDDDQSVPGGPEPPSSATGRIACRIKATQSGWGNSDITPQAILCRRLQATNTILCSTLHNIANGWPLWILRKTNSFRAALARFDDQRFRVMISRETTEWCLVT